MIQRFTTFSACVLICLWASACAAQPATAPAPSGGIADFMVMDVCVNAADRVIPNMTPLDAGCAHRRKIRAGEPIPYFTHNFPMAGSPCKDRLGTISKESVPVAKNGLTRFVIYYDKGVDPTCPGVTPEDPRFGRLDPTESGSVLWLDNGYSFWMGSWSLDKVSTFKSPVCQPGANTSRQFYRGRILAPTQGVSASGAAGYGLFESKLAPGAPSATMQQCPSDYGRHITMWYRAPARYRSGIVLDSIVTSHYTKADASGAGLGEAMQMERSYWTKEFGFTRWEKWAREDWVNPRSNRGVKDLAAQLYTENACGAPHPTPTSVSPGMSFSDPRTNGAYSEMVTDPRTGQQHRWYMAICLDFSNIVIDPTRVRPPDWTNAIDAAYWAP